MVCDGVGAFVKSSAMPDGVVTCGDFFHEL